MMDLRLDRVVRKAADSKSVYSLLLTEEGLYLFYTGIVGGLVFDDTSDESRKIVVDDETLPLIEAMIKTEARVKSLPLEQLVLEDDHNLIPFHSVTDLRAVVQPNHSRLVIEVGDEVFDFLFTASSDAEIKEFTNRLRRYVEETDRAHH